MSMAPVDHDNDTDLQSDRPVDAMKASLDEHVANWSAEDNETAPEKAAELTQPPAKQAALRSATPVKRAKSATAAVKQPVAGKKPFRMSYDGVTAAEHIEYLIAHGAR